MARVADHLVDTSAWARAHHRPSVRQRLEELILAGRVATCTVVDLEVLYAAQSRVEYSEMREERAAFPVAPLDQSGLERALEVQAALAKGGRHRGVALPDLLVAAAAERAGLTVLHYDADFDRISAVTGQPAEWVVARGSVP
jgi:predicted nucleic acid-binding protein